MIQVQRFNKVLKLAVILGDLVILNVLFMRCHTASSGSPCRPNCIPGTPQRGLFLFFIDRTDGIIRT